MNIIQKEFKEGPGRATYYWLGSLGMVLTALVTVIYFGRAALVEVITWENQLVIWIGALGGLSAGAFPLIILRFRYPSMTWIASQAAYSAVAAIMLSSVGMATFQIGYNTRIVDLLEKMTEREDRHRVESLQVITDAIKSGNSIKLASFTEAHRLALAQFSSRAQSAPALSTLKDQGATLHFPTSWRLKDIGASFVLLLGVVLCMAASSRCFKRAMNRLHLLEAAATHVPIPIAATDTAAPNTQQGS